MATPDDAKRAILARRARFVAAALAGIGCNEAPPAAVPQVEIAPAPIDAAMLVEEPPLPVPTASEPASAMDSDGDGIPDALDVCPHEKGQPSSTPTMNGCPPLPLACLSIVYLPPQPLFAAGRADLSPAAMAALDDWVTQMQSYPQSSADVQGHCDNTEAPAIADRRAAAAKAYLVKHGVDARRVRALGAGATKPVASNATPAGREKNRRVELQLR